MASPFNIFRRHQKVMIATLGVLAMIAFVFIPIYQLSERGRVKDPVLVSTAKFGNLTRGQVQVVGNRRVQLAVFLEAAATEIARRGNDPSGLREFIRTLREGSEEATVTHWLMVREAERMGLVVTDDMINRELAGLIRPLALSDVPKIIQGSQFRGFSEYALRSALREEILAIWLQRLFATNLSPAAMPPAERWDYFRRLNRFAQIEAIAVPVAQYTSAVKTPDDATLREFFEQHKATEPLPDSPEPAFRQPHRVAFQYFKLDRESFQDAVTDEEIVETYKKDERYAGFQKLLEEAIKPKPEERPATKAAPQDAKPAPKDTAPKSEKKADPKPAAKSEPAGSSAAPRRSPFRLVAHEQEKPAADKAEKPAADKTEKPAADKTEKPAGDKIEKLPADKVEKPTADTIKKPPADKTAKPAAATSPPLPPEKEPVSEEDKKAAAQRRLAEEKAAAGRKPGEKPGFVPGAPQESQLPKPVPQWIKIEIRRGLAIEKMQEVMQELQAEMDKYAKARNQYERKRQKNGTPPKPLDFAAVARQALDNQGMEKGITAGSTGLVSAAEARFSFEIGRSFIVTPGSGLMDATIQAFDRVAYSDNVSLFQPQASEDSHSRYLYWKTEETKDRVPSFDDPGEREKVLKVWRLVQARPAAEEAAGKLRDEAAKAKRSLKEVLAGRTVLAPAPFSWLTVTAGQSQISKVEGIELPGREFMRTVFSLPRGDVGVAMDQMKTAAYVVRVVEFAPTEKELMEKFEREPAATYEVRAGEKQRESMAKWLKELKASAGLKWEMPPDQRPERSEEQPSQPAPFEPDE